MAGLLLEAAEDALIRELGPAVDLLTSAPTIQQGIRATLDWIEAEGQRTPGSTILAEAMVKATRDPAFRRWTRRASRRWRKAILERLQRASADGEIEATLDLEATAVLLAAALDGLLFHRLVDAELDVKQTDLPIEAMLSRGRISNQGGRR
jgi:hypothetical protein